MAWKKIVKLVAVATCPNCGNHGFNMKFHPTGDEVRPDDRVECAACGHVCTSAEVVQAGQVRRED
jgi:Zn ribbon nucleic-acid-binding protein